MWKDLYQLDIPVLGIKVGSDDLALLGTMGLLVLAVWSWFTHRREWASSVAVNTLARRLFVRQSHALLAKLHHAVVSELVFAPVRIGAPLPQTPTGLRRIVAWLFLLTLLLGGAVLLMAKGWGAAPPADGAVAAEYTWRVGGIILVVILVVLLGLGKLLRGIRRWTRRAALLVMQVLAPSMVSLFLLGGDVYDVVFVPIVHLDPSARALITSLFVKGNELLLWGPTPDWAEAPAGAWIPGRWRDALPCTTIITSRRGKFPCHAKLREVTVGSDGKRTISWRKQRKS